jgi:hypothetical protein
VTENKYEQAGDKFKSEIPGESFNVARDLGRTAKSLSGYQCCDIGTTGLTINPGTPIRSWQRLVRDLDNMWFAGEVKDLMIKFYAGDAINQGCELFGESHQQAFGAESHWSPGYINNITWTCRKVPQEHRSIRLKSWRFHQDLASLTYEEQGYYLSLANELFDSGNKEWYKEVLSTLSDDKRRALLRQVKPEDREYWLMMIDRHDPKWTALRDWISGAKMPPPEAVPLPEWVSGQIKVVSDRITLTQDMKDAMVSMLFDLADGIKANSVEL